MRVETNRSCFYCNYTYVICEAVSLTLNRANLNGNIFALKGDFKLVTVFPFSQKNDNSKNYLNFKYSLSL